MRETTYESFTQPHETLYVDFILTEVEDFEGSVSF